MKARGKLGESYKTCKKFLRNFVSRAFAPYTFLARKDPLLTCMG